MATISAARHRQEKKSYKTKYKALKKLENSDPHMEVAALFRVPKNALWTWKQEGFVAKRVKPEKYEALNKAVKKWLVILRSENVPVSGPRLLNSLIR